MLRNFLLFPRLLRAAGIAVSLEQAVDFTRALEWIDLGRRQQVRDTARALLVGRREDLKLFEQLFDAFWQAPGSGAGARRAPPEPRRPPQPKQRFDIVSYMASRPGRSDPEIDVGDRTATFSPREVLQQKSFSELTPEELSRVRRLIQEMRWQASLRTTRRWRPDRRGAGVDIRGALRDAAKHGGVLLRLERLRRKVKQRPIVVLADISGSMETVSRLVLQFFYSLSHSLRQVECFVFGTRLSRVTPALRLRNVDRAVDEAARRAVDWGGGTRIGDSLRAFNRQWSRRVLRRGALVLVISDGWERGDVSTLRLEMAHLQRRCHRLLWLNPHLGTTGYQPVVEGMAAALPFVDDFLPVHNLQSLEELATHLRLLPRRRSGAAGRAWRIRAGAAGEGSTQVLW